jgi:surface polysaccharide O-acyltransferase-like enzyme
MDSMSYKRNHSLDIARVVATLTVVMIHCSAIFAENYKQYTSEFIFGNLFDSISRIGVPLFLMISGSLFLDEHREVTLKGIFLKNIKSIAIITIIWTIIYSSVYNVIYPLLTSETINAKRFLDDIVNGPYHMWYLYMIIGLYIITPFLKKFVCKENKGMILFFIIISLCVQFIKPVINAICKLGLNLSFINTWLNKFHLDFFGGYITYFLVGWYIVHIGIKQKWIRYIIYSLGAISLLSIFFYVYFTCDYNNAYSNIGLPVFIYSVSVFLALNNIRFNFKEKTAKKLMNLSKLTFGVYIIHVMVLSIYSKLFPYRGYSALYIVVCFAIVVCSSFLVSYVISKIPVLKKMIKA